MVDRWESRDSLVWGSVEYVFRILAIRCTEFQSAFGCKRRIFLNSDWGRDVAGVVLLSVCAKFSVQSGTKRSKREKQRLRDKSVLEGWVKAAELGSCNI